MKDNTKENSRKQTNYAIYTFLTISYINGQVLHAKRNEDEPEPSSTTKTFAQVGQNKSIITIFLLTPF